MINATMNHLDDTLTALADPTRRQVVELLRQGPRRASDIADAVGMSRQATSRHLNVLRARGIVEVDLVDADGRGRAYRLRPERLAALLPVLDRELTYRSTYVGIDLLLENGYEFSADTERLEVAPLYRPEGAGGPLYEYRIGLITNDGMPHQDTTWRRPLEGFTESIFIGSSQIEEVLAQ